MEYEQGAVNYFDYVKWEIVVEQNFTFEYKFLEDDLNTTNWLLLCSQQTRVEKIALIYLWCEAFILFISCTLFS